MFHNLFKGRYGVDTLTYVLFFGAAIFMNFKYIWVLGLGLLGYAFFRIFSKNIFKRREELQKFNSIMKRFGQNIMGEGMKLGRLSQSLQNKYNNYKVRRDQKKYYVFLQCPKCKRTLRLPKNKGKLSVTCPICKNEFLKKT